MALVAYDYGSDSEEENEELLNTEGGTANKVDIISQVEKDTLEKPSEEISDEDDIISPTSTIFKDLPQKKVVVQEILEDKVEDFIPKAQISRNSRSKVKITIPSLSDFDDLNDEEPSCKKRKPSSKGSGLLSLLPPVKCVPISNKSFIPNVLSQRGKTTAITKHKAKVNKIQNKVAEAKPYTSTEQKDESDDDIELPETFDEELWQKTCGKVVKKKIIEPEPIIEEPSINIAPEAVQPYEGLNNEAFKELVGTRSRMPRNIKLIDVNEEELVSEKDLWMTKSLTDPEFVPRTSEEESVDPTKRKKHHITYLAQQAKANEQELQSQWSSSKFNRNQARAKYGF